MKGRNYMKKSISTIAVVFSILMIFCMVSPVLAESTPQLTLAPRLHGNNSDWASTNWSGYAVTSDAGSVTTVSGSWIVPSVTGAKKTNAYSAFWLGIDGFSATSNTVEQIGTSSDIQNGRASYYAWFEMYPNPAYKILMTIKPGDVISASVTYSSGTFTLQLTDQTSRRGFSIQRTSPDAERSSAEWIAEAPATISGNQITILPLANFNTVTFSSCTATTTLNSGTISSFGSAVQSITMTNGADPTSPNYYVKAYPSTLSSNSFSVTWQHS
jgi:hypothetical protein